MFVAIINTPGYLPDSAEELPTFDTAQEAWAYLAEQREYAEDFYFYTDNSATLDELWALATETTIQTGFVHGDTPGYEGSHDLGLIYQVEVDSAADNVLQSEHIESITCARWE